MCIGLNQSVEGMNRAKDQSFSRRRKFFNKMTSGFILHHQLSWVWSLQAHTGDFGLVNLHDHVSQFLTINPLLF